MENLKRKQVMSQKEKYKRAAKGDIAYNMMRMWQGALGPAPVDGLVSPAYVVVKPFEEANSAYYSYLFRTDAYMREVNKFSRGIVADRNRLYWDEFKQMPSLVPPRPEQDQIVAYLRAQDAHIARFIKAKRDLIGLLNEQKLRIIDLAVTRGLDTSVTLKPSGVEWLGDVPKHWEVQRLKGRSRVWVEWSGSIGKVNYSDRDLFAIDTTFYVDRTCSKANIRWLYYLLVWCRLDRISKDSAVPGLESLTQVIHESRADDGGSQSEQSGMNIEAALEANPELAETSKPGMCALDDPTMTPEPLTAFDTTAGNTGLDAALSQIAPATSEVIPFEWNQAWARMPSNRADWLP
ncbi:hypothetical protein NLI96_g13272 [Meripilus lineatus]|uniref:Type I restriction modification DNA specificity domain-containing protein n=1 Tax=Meripilus lineatus TaxID=2056292 RepID=A0AAD5Y6W4_9APHY|nr:hypothetical protein NLI96_g13272 [Physisporinus lineatus]